MRLRVICGLAGALWLGGCGDSGDSGLFGGRDAGAGGSAGLSGSGGTAGSGTGGSTTGGTAGSTTGGTAGSTTGGTAGAATGGTGGATGGAGGATGGTGGAAGGTGGATGGTGGATGGTGGATGGTGGATGGTGGATGGTGGAGGAGGIGTYVSELVGLDTNPGTQALPVRTIAQGIAHATTLGGGVDVYIAEGHYSEKVTLVEGISLIGGHQCDQNSCTWARDPAQYDSAILAQDAEGTLAGDTITRATAIDGLRLMGQNGSGTGRGRVALTLRGGTPVVQACRIYGPDTSSGNYPSGRSIAVLVAGPSNATQGADLHGNTIQGGNANDSSQGLIFEGISGVTGSSYASVQRNVIHGGSGVSSNAVAAWNTGAGTRLVDNDVWTGQATSTNGSAWAIALGGTIDVEANRVNVGVTGASCPNGGTRWCGGINSASSTSNVRNNVVLGIGSGRSAAVYLNEAEVPAGVVVLSSNTLDGRGTSSGGNTLSAAVVLSIGACSSCGFNGRVGRIRNNLLLPGQGNQAYGVYEDPTAGKTQHPSALENNDFVPANSGALYRFYDGSTQTLVTTLAGVNGLVISGSPVGSNVSAGCQLDVTFHIAAATVCDGGGTAIDAPPTDFEGDARPSAGSYDIGADER